ncbi:MAG: phosphoglucosamine mutase [Clostridiales bacterium]|nr:phosphoglucosamine mutase [Clostridiales bacterium]
MGRLFGTDGVRGVANKELTTELAYKIGRAGAYVLAGELKHKPTIIIGKDTRISGDMLEASLISGICSVGANVIRAGVIPTPGIAYLTRLYKCDAGVVISASHNSFEFNGIKFFNGNGYKLSDEVENEIESIIFGEVAEPEAAEPENVGCCIEKPNCLEDYAKFLQGIGTDLTGKKIAIDCANGASYIIAKKVLEALGATVLVIGNNPDGININKDCGSTHMEGLQKFVVENKADLGLAFDGDADRLLAVDENGKLVDGDKILVICGKYLKEKGKLKNNAIVGTIMSNMGFDVAGKEYGINTVRTKVGDRYVLEEMMDKGYILGGEQSGHVIFLEHNTTGDGILTALNVLNVIADTNKKLSELAKQMTSYPQVVVNAKVTNERKKSYLEDVKVKELIEKTEEMFKGEGRVVIRASGTEPLIRVMIEGKEQKVIEEKANEIAKAISDM